ncbi:DMT family transporter [Anaeromyxobacter terrae]|uniref:DMT family transporter n=1 Tax=Anaeromyxobacter terrae TaxID=2925406 RepID=UPI001F55C067|nr:DMT family transporter [Anaeromyxobacter sp. SG22]
MLAAAALVCFAANSLLARAALREGRADPASFTAIRVASGAAFLALLAAARRRPLAGGSWTSAAALLGYAAAFSLAYVRIPTGVGALLLFPAVQVTMIGVGVAQGARPTRRQWLGVAVALAGLAYLTRPGAHDADPAGAALMVLAGVSWGVYSLRGRTAKEPLGTTGDNFVRATVLALPLASAFLLLEGGRLGVEGAALAIVSGALASGGGYTLWYAVVPWLGATRAATLQVSVPALAAAGGVLVLGEPLSLRLVVSAAIILSGVALTLARPGG